MKNIIYLFFSIFLLSCSDTDEVQPYAMNRNTNIAIQVLNENGEKVLINGEVNREDVIIQYKKDNTYLPKESTWCNDDKSDFLLADEVYGIQGTTSYKLTFPNQEVFYVDVTIAKEPGDNLHWFITNVKINDTIVFEGDKSEQGSYCENGAGLQIDLVLNQ